MKLQIRFIFTVVIIILTLLLATDRSLPQCDLKETNIPCRKLMIIDGKPTKINVVGEINPEPIR